MKARKLFKKRYKGKLKFVKKKRKNFRKRWNIYIYIHIYRWRGAFKDVSSGLRASLRSLTVRSHGDLDFS